MIEVVALAVFAGLLRGGKLQRLSEIRIKKFPLVFFAFLIRLLVVFYGGRGVYFFVNYGQHLQIFAFILLLYALYCNGPVLRLIGFGVLLNFIVIAANGGVMPVLPSAIELAGIDSTLYVTHVLVSEGTRLWLLSDIIPIPPPYPLPRVISIGDLFIVAGFFSLISNQMLTPLPSDDQVVETRARG